MNSEDEEMARLAKKYPERSLNFFTLEMKVRRYCIKIMEFPGFDMFILFLIAFNTVLLGIYDYSFD